MVAKCDTLTHMEMQKYCVVCSRHKGSVRFRYKVKNGLLRLEMVTSASVVVFKSNKCKFIIEMNE